MYKHLRHLPRGVGHTHAALSAAKQNPHAVVVVHLMRQAHELMNANPGTHVLSLSQLRAGKSGTRPVVFDANAVQVIVEHYENEIGKLRSDMAKAKELLGTL